jgi:hypothetical protein
MWFTECLQSGWPLSFSVSNCSIACDHEVAPKAIMYRSISNYIFLNQFCFGVGFHMIFIPIEGCVVFLCPPGINIFLCQFMGLHFPLLWRCSCFFYVLVFFALFKTPIFFGKKIVHHPVRLTVPYQYLSAVGHFPPKS